MYRVVSQVSFIHVFSNELMSEVKTVGLAALPILPVLLAEWSNVIINDSSPYNI